MSPQSIVDFVNTFLAAIGNGASTILLSLGVDPNKVGSLLNIGGLFLAGIITVAIITVGIISYIKGSQYEPFFNSYEDDNFVRGKAGTIMGILSIICAVWFLFAIVSVYFLN